jgi:hypothetical protein
MAEGPDVFTTPETASVDRIPNTSAGFAKHRVPSWLLDLAVSESTSAGMFSPRCTTRSNL